MNLPDDNDLRNARRDMLVVIVAILAALFGWLGRSLLGCASHGLPPEPDYTVTEIRIRDAGHDADAGDAEPWDATLGWWGVPDPDHTYVPHRMR